MNIFRRVANAIKQKAAGLAPVVTSSIGYNYELIRDWYAGAWQRGEPPIRMSQPLENAAIYACISRLAGDFSMMRPELQEQRGGIWQAANIPSSELMFPNMFETTSQFWEHWLISLLTFGNAFIYTRSDAWFILNPQKVRILVANNGSGAIYYECAEDLQCGITESVILGPGDIIHGRINAQIGINPVLGIPPVHAAALAAELGANAKHAAENIYNNASRPSGIIKVPGAVGGDKLREIKAGFEGGYSGENRGKTAVLSDGMEFVPYESANLVDSELIAALKLSAEQVAAIFGIPGYKIGAGAYPAYAGQSQADQAYLNGTLQRYIALTEELVGRRICRRNQRVFFDPSPLLRLDLEKHVAVLASAVAGCLMSPNEARQQLNLPPVTGGEYPLSQQQYFSLPALAKRDTSANPFNSATPAANDDKMFKSPGGSFITKEARPYLGKREPLYCANSFNFRSGEERGTIAILPDGPHAKDYSGRETFLESSFWELVGQDIEKIGVAGTLLLIDHKNHPINTPLKLGSDIFIKREGMTGHNKRKIRLWSYMGDSMHWEQQGGEFKYVA
ncbi:TPA: phage portal protein [Klebsiella pneumoniae]|uniref:phage portal protein n=1 Tax=Klebsiella pneumoniae TaxID=573 RepID=UPI001E49B325|nr:phage portal protein [Klebsiella pneumoniae]MCD5936998.1 phage portal protein [Klebsiella pneumoniae]HBS7549513.1 phage portal protein [Klebsiella pneumoniae]HBU3718205.1 phage portal protein [Klebsiella pneumoniae]HBX5355697.1 phage portal protein [Klebsiella pneumoniae]HBY4307919.1 phage portal protein [Klebsiella pneumoniae]